MKIKLPPTHRKTKIVATLGPASNSPQRIAELIDAGVNVFRLNFSHGSHAQHSQSLKLIREISADKGLPVGILQDLAGPKIRISSIEGDFATVKDGEILELRKSQGQKSHAHCVYVEGLNPAEIVKEGQSVLLADGIIELVAEKLQGDSVQARVIKGGRIRSRVGIAFPESTVDLPATTEKDMEDFLWGLRNEVDFVAISFVQSAEDIERLRKAMTSHGGQVQIIAKIERRIAVDKVCEILDAADGAMVARGDLGLELPLEQVPIVQRKIIEEANFRGIPVIVATQMLTSMVTAVRPTRAEVSDVSTAVMSGADAVMLSEETTIGEHPVECVRFLHRIASEAEKTFVFDEYKLRLRKSDSDTVPDAIAYAACAAAIKVKAQALISCTETGNSARLIAKYRPQQPLYGLSTRDRTLRRLCLTWGVLPLQVPPALSHEDEVIGAMKRVQKHLSLDDKALAVVTGGLTVNTPGATSVLQVRQFNFENTLITSDAGLTL